MAKWVIVLNEFNIFYYPRSSMKVQVLTDFLVECMWSDDKPEKVIIKQLAEQPNPRMTWILHVEGVPNSQRSGVGLILTNLKWVVIEYALCFSFKATNNQAKYKAFLAGLKLAKQLKVKSLRIFIDLAYS